MTILPIRGRLSSRTPLYLWIPGIAVGLMTGGAWWLGAREISPLFGAALALGTEAILTRGLHHDGLCDVSDAFFAHTTPKRRLEIMDDPRVGALGVMSLVIYLVLRLAVLDHLSPSPLMLGGVAGLSRLMMTGGLCLMPKARTEGMANVFGSVRLDLSLVFVSAVGLLASLALLLLASGIWATFWALLASVLAGLMIFGWAIRALGGVSGDVLGAAGLAADLAALFSLGIQ